MMAVARGEQWFADRPRDRERRIVPGDPDFTGWVVHVGALVLDLRDWRDDTEAVGEAGGDVALAEVVGAQRDGDPVAERRRAPPYVGRDVVDLSFDDPYELGLGPLELQVQAAERPSGGP